MKALEALKNLQDYINKLVEKQENEMSKMMSEQEISEIDLHILYIIESTPKEMNIRFNYIPHLKRISQNIKTYDENNIGE